MANVTSSSPASTASAPASMSSCSNRRMSRSGYSPRSRRTIAGSRTLDTLWNVPTSMPADCSGQEAVDRIAGGVDPGDDVAGVAEHDLAERGQLDRAGPAGAVEQRAADEPFEGGDLLADRRLGVAEAGGRAAERALGGDGVEGDEVAELEVAELAHDHQRS